MIVLPANVEEGVVVVGVEELAAQVVVVVHVAVTHAGVTQAGALVLQHRHLLPRLHLLQHHPPHGELYCALAGPADHPHRCNSRR